MASLARDLAGVVDGEVRFDAASRALYAHDLSIYRQVPIGVVLPRTADAVVAAVEICRAHDAPILARGGGTSLVGQCTNEAVVLDCSKYLNRILDIDPEARLARVQPGVVCDRVRDAAAPHRLTFGPDPATHAWCTFGGMIGNNSCGVHSVLSDLYGQGPRTSDQVEELEVLTYRGERFRAGRGADGVPHRLGSALRTLADRYGDRVRERFPDIPRRVSGYNLDELLPENGFHVARALAASEGTCAIVLEATVRLVESPPARSLAVLGYPDQYRAADDVMALLEHRPIGLEGFDGSVTRTMDGLGLYGRERGLLPDGDAWLLIEFGGESPGEAADRAHALAAEIDGKGPVGLHVFTEPGEQASVWRVRESALGASRIPGKFETWPSFEDAAVHPARLGPYLRDFARLLDRHGYRCVYFGHYGQGCVHCRIDFDLRTREGVATFKRFLEAASDLVLEYGGSLTGEHGDGQAHGAHLEKMFGSELVGAFREFKAAWDPDRKLNPGKLVDAYPVDANLRVGPDYRRRGARTYFRFPDDGGSFAAATERCFGMGRCRQTEGGTMCPSYMATLEEKHSTRGRAHLLFELMRGEEIGRRGWRERGVKDALDLCLACKACKGECPVHVDVATYKAEFLAHWYERRLRPPRAYALGLVDRWARLASHAPALANAFAPALARAAGLARERPLPGFAPRPFRACVAQHKRRGVGEPVVLWPDTFTNYFDPDVGVAAVRVLEAAGFRVELPPRPLCCGRPLYDFGMLTAARRRLTRILDELRPALRAELPIVVLEPSCLSVFQDELRNLLPADEDAGRLARQAVSLTELLGTAAYEPPRRSGRVVVHPHCHARALAGTAGDEALLARAGLDVEVLNAGCCGLAGSFGYEHYDVSMRVGERALLPAVRAAAPDAVLVADGFSCRQQIAHATGRQAHHVAQVLGG